MVLKNGSFKFHSLKKPGSSNNSTSHHFFLKIPIIPKFSYLSLTNRLQYIMKVLSFILGFKFILFEMFIQ